ncbi:MAG: hypothetical protein OEZ01_11825 [Candidatus Heimdallarchaeota archaeon]|nr:hypothetical protein [Candidatus Heimdallarchaeota archaeon]MDH5646692.1 hypothetical protein [Candidatus Heimdallarchaeota archaeon]
MKIRLIRFYFIIEILLIFLLSINVGAQGLVQDYNLTITEDHDLKVKITSQDLWDESGTGEIRISFNLTRYPTNTSIYRIHLLVVALIDDAATSIAPITQRSNSSQDGIDVESDSILLFTELFETPNVDRFYFNITFYGRAIGGNNSETETNLHSIRYPQDGPIIVVRDNIIPRINLYGFPPFSFFQRWLPFYGIFILMICSPGIIYGVNKYMHSKRSKMESKGDDEVVINE